MVRVLVACLVLTLGGQQGPVPAGQFQSTLPTFDKVREERLRAWLKAADDHQCGLSDAAVQTIARWPRVQLTDAKADFLEFTRVLTDLRRQIEESGQEWVAEYRGRRWRRTDIERLIGLTPAESAIGNVNRVVRRIAMLHTDIATLVRQQTAAPPPAVWATSGRGDVTPTLRIFDGQLVGVEDSAMHWQVARDMLDLVVPKPDADPFVRIWYRATSAYQANLLRWSDVGPNLTQGLVVFPKDAQLIYYNAVRHELFASSSYQDMVTVGLSHGIRVGIEPTVQELQIAASAFQEALTLVPDFPDAHLHFGHVLGLQGNHAEAARELTKALDVVTIEEAVYYGALFLGHEQQELGQSADARASFERAAALYPQAQSPLLALSQLARRDGDSPAALAALTRLLGLPPDERDRYDPWWTFDRAHVRNAGELMDAMRQTFQAENSR